MKGSIHNAHWSLQANHNIFWAYKLLYYLLDNDEQPIPWHDQSREHSHLHRDIIVARETEEGHDKIVEEVLKWLKENDLFVKLEKYWWKVKEIEFLGIVIGPKEVEIQKEKVEGILS